MPPKKDSPPRKPVILKPNEGRKYHMGRIVSVFKADGKETDDQYSVSEWWLEPNTSGPGIHFHDEDDLFYVIKGTMSFYVTDRWLDATEGSFVLVPGGTKHDFRNQSRERAGLLNFSHPGGFEPGMPAIVDWFKEHPPGDIEE